MLFRSIVLSVLFILCAFQVNAQEEKNNGLPILKIEKPLLGSISSDQAYHDMGAFCKMEVQINKVLPLKIRLGEVKNTERMEGKYLLPRR